MWQMKGGLAGGKAVGSLTVVHANVVKRGQLENWVWHPGEQFYSGNIFGLGAAHVLDGDAYETRYVPFTLAYTLAYTLASTLKCVP
jgi:hypothetical protein